MIEFIPLHMHSDASLLDGISKPQQIAEKCKELGYKASAITNHGNISDAVSFFKACKKQNIKPILGSEFYLCQQDSLRKEQDNRKLSHLCVLAKNLNGWKSLIKATSFANEVDRFYYKPRLKLEDFQKFAGNLIAFSGHIGSDLANIIFTEPSLAYSASSYDDAKMLVRQDWEKQVVDLAGRYSEIFGKSNFFFEIQTIDSENIPAALIVARILRYIAKKQGYTCIATADSHYTTRESASDQRVVLCTAFETTLSRVQSQLDNNDDITLGGFFRSNNYHIPSLEDIQKVNEEEEINNSYLVSEMCEEYNILRNPILPNFQCPNNQDQNEYIMELCKQGWQNKIANQIDKSQESIYKDRLKKETNIIKDAGLAGYFLIVHDYCNFARENNILVGSGRGSAAGSLLSYVLNITDVDPIKYNLIFERFYNSGRNTKDRVSLPDIDCDFSANKRDQIINYMKKKYGEDKVCQMATFSRMQGRSALKDVLRAHEACSFDEMNEITSYIPDESKIIDDLQEMREEEGESSIIKWALENNSKSLKQWCELTDNGYEGPYAKYFEQAIRLEGTKRSQGKHAAGVIIANEPLIELCPLIYDKSNNTVIAGLEMGDLEAIGCTKFDVLSLSTLSNLEHLKDILEKVRI